MDDFDTTDMSIVKEEVYWRSDWEYRFFDVGGNFWIRFLGF
jgi:hypothetical protein